MSVSQEDDSPAHYRCVGTARVHFKGFDERYTFGGEDIDFGLRLSKVGHLAYAKEAVVLHNYDDGLRGFVRRFIEYGKGNRLVEKYHDIHLIPLPFTARKKVALINNFLAILQWICLLIGYAYMHFRIKMEISESSCVDS